MYFSQNAFLFGLLMGLGMVLTSMLHSFFCLFWKVPIQKVSVFFDPWFAIKKARIELTEFTLGWLPLGSYITPLHKPEKETDISLKINSNEFYLEDLSAQKQQLFKLVPFAGFFVIYLTSLFILDRGQNVFQNFVDSWTMLYKGAVAIFSDALARAEYGKYISSELIHKSVLGVSVTLYMGVFLISLLITPISNLLTGDKEKENKIMKAIKTVLFFLFAYFLFWKFPSFVFSYFTTAKFFAYLFNAIAGIALIGIITYYLILTIYKFRNRI
jgi:hypothetical protein